MAAGGSSLVLGATGGGGGGFLKDIVSEDPAGRVFQLLSNPGCWEEFSKETPSSCTPLLGGDRSALVVKLGSSKVTQPFELGPGIVAKL